MNRFVKDQTPECGVCRFKAVCIYNKLDAQAQKAWNQQKLSRKYADNEAVYTEGQHPQGLYTVCKGRVKISSADARGQQMICWIRHPGEQFGHIAFFSEKKYSGNGRVMGDTIISFMEGKTLEKFLDAHPKTYKVLLHKVATELSGLQLKLKDTAYKPARSKVAAALIHAVSFKTRDTDRQAIYGLKRTEIAEITGLALETVVRTLAELEKRNVIKREVKSIKILDIKTLARIADPHAKTQLPD